ncbi:MAG TPA: hypothetical protein VLZ89_01460, partial [Anaerolineales bacterium]|nr:hypothetical protein [Anaerolineales bacterium]
MSKKSFFGPDKLKEARKNRLWILVTASPMIIAGLVLFLFATPVTPALASLFFFLMGLSGVIVMIRRELPTSLYKIAGWPAVLEGAIFTAFCWGMGVDIYLSSTAWTR